MKVGMCGMMQMGEAWTEVRQEVHTQASGFTHHVLEPECQ
jgi:hypothetical protein